MGRKSKNKNKNKGRFRLIGGELVEITDKPKQETKPDIKKDEPPRSKDQSATDFKLEIPDDIYQKISWWMHKADHEVSGFGSLEFDEVKNQFTVKDVILLKQEVGPASAEIDPISMGRAMFRLKDSPNALKWHWHSHVDMGVFWSADDRELIQSLGQKGWILATVFNRKKEHKTAFMTTVEVMGRPHDLFVDNIVTHIQRYLPAELCAALDAEYADNVKPKSHAPMVPDSGYVPGGGWGFPDDYDYYAPHGRTGSMEDTLDERRWHPSVRIIMAHEYDDNGYTKAPDGVWRYNPVYDKDVRTEEDKFMMIATEMDMDEVTWMRERSPAFDKLVRDYYVALATQPNLPHTQEGVEV